MNRKNILNIIISCLFLSSPLFSQTGNLVVFSTSDDYFHIGLDNKFQNGKSNTNVKVTGIPEGDYWVTIMFNNPNKKPIKSSVKVLEDKEVSYILELEKEVLKLKFYSNVPKNQVQSLNTKQSVVAYNTKGVEAKGLKSTKEIPPNLDIVRNDIVRVQGDRNDHKKRMGNYSGSSSTETKDNSTAETVQKEPETGTTVLSEYIQIVNTDGTTKIVDERTTIVKEIVERNGQKQMRTKKSKTHTDTDFTCLPMKKEAFVALIQSVEKTENKLEVAQNGVKGQCMTPGQIKTIGDLIKSDAEKNNFAIAAKSVCADPSKFPYTITEPVVVKQEEVEKEKVVEVVKEEEETLVVEKKPKTKAELKAELKALKQKEKAEKLADKQKKKAEKKAAKAKEKAEKKAAKEAANNK